MKKDNNINYSLKRIFTSSLIVFVGVFLSKILTYLYRILIARFYGPEIYGLFSLAIILILSVVAFSSFGLFQGLLRFVPLYRGKKKLNNIRYILKFSLTLIFFSGITSCFLIFYFSEFISLNIFHNFELIIFLKIFSFVIPFYLFFYAFLSVIQGFEKTTIQSFFQDFLENFLKLFVLLFFILFGIKNNSVPLSYFLGVFLVSLLSFIYCKYKIPLLFKKYYLSTKLKKEIRNNLLSYSWPLVFSTILYSFLSSIDSCMIGYFKGSTLVGVYNAAIPIAVLLTIFPALFTRLFFPLANKEFSKKNLNLLSELSKQVQKWILIFNLPIFMLIFIFPGVFINLLFGSEYTSALNSLRILSIGYIFYSLSVVPNNLIFVYGKSKIILLDVILITLLNFFLNLFLIPKYGLEGAAFSTSLSFVLLSIIFFFQSKYYSSITVLRRKMVSIILSSGISTFLICFIKKFLVINFLSIIFIGVFFFLTYLILIFLTKSFDKNDIEILKFIKSKIYKF